MAEKPQRHLEIVKDSEDDFFIESKGADIYFSNPKLGYPLQQVLAPPDLKLIEGGPIRITDVKRYRLRWKSFWRFWFNSID